MNDSRPVWLQLGQVSRAEWRWVLKWAAFVLLLASLPYLLAMMTSNDKWVFTGSLLFRDDINSYFAKMRSGREGHWLFYDRYTPEEGAGIWVYGFYILLGKVARLLGLSEPIAFHVARVLNGLLLLVCAYSFLSDFLNDVSQRRVGFLMLSFSAGLGWLPVILNRLDDMAYKPTDLWVPESLTFFSLYLSPHFAMGMALLMVAFLLFRRAWSSGRVRYALLCGSTGLLVSQVYPLAVVNLYAVIGICFLWWTIRHRRIDVQKAVLTALTLIIALPMIAYEGYALNADPILDAWIRIDNWSPSLGAYLWGYGLLVPLALTGLFVSWRRKKQSDPLLSIWLAVGWVVLYLPFSQQRRLSMGLHIPMCAWATVGLMQGVIPAMQRWLPRLWGAKRSQLFVAIVVFVSSVTHIFLLASGVFGAVSRQWPYFLHRSEMGALRWLNAHLVESDVVLADYVIGNFIPAWSAGRVFLGHWAETADVDGKEALLDQFFRSQTSDQERRQIVETYGITYLYYGSEERSRGDYLPGYDPLWKEVYANEHVSILKWASDESRSQ